jgi:hypothetical protein
MKATKKTWLFIILCITIGNSLQAQENYPVPVKTDKLLFYFQRSHNKNTVVYELNTLPDGKINIDKPVIAYWIRFEEGGARKELSFMQRKAFGLQWQLADKVKESFILHFNSFKKREIYLLKVNESNVYKAYIKINGELSELTKMYIKSENNSLGIPLSVKYIEISGINLMTGKIIVEKYIP